MTNPRLWLEIDFIAKGKQQNKSNMSYAHGSARNFEHT